MSPGRAPTPQPPARTARQLREAATAARRRPRPDADANPLRQGLRLERVPDPCAFVLFGATGDLAHRKVIPAIYQLWRTNLLPAEFSLNLPGGMFDDPKTPHALMFNPPVEPSPLAEWKANLPKVLALPPAAPSESKAAAESLELESYLDRLVT